MIKMLDKIKIVSLNFDIKIINSAFSLVSNEIPVHTHRVLPIKVSHKAGTGESDIRLL